MDLVKSLTAEVEFSTLKGGRVIYAVFVAYVSKTLWDWSLQIYPVWGNVFCDVTEKEMSHHIWNHEEPFFSFEKTL